MSEEAVGVMTALSRGASAAAPLLGPVGGVVALVVSEALALGASILSDGGDPVEELRRIRDRGPTHDAMRARWEREMAERHGLDWTDDGWH